jgi:hypothetical protein
MYDGNSVGGLRGGGCLMAINEVAINRFAVGDEFQIKLEGAWYKFWDRGIRDNDDAIEAREIVANKGFKPNLPREFRSVGIA